VGRAVEAGEISVDLPTEVQAEIKGACGQLQEKRYAHGVHTISVELKLPVEKVEDGLAGLEA
jgi:hypothetical protein